MVDSESARRLLVLIENEREKGNPNVNDATIASVQAIIAKKLGSLHDQTQMNRHESFSGSHFNRQVLNPNRDYSLKTLMIYEAYIFHTRQQESRNLYNGMDQASSGVNITQLKLSIFENKVVTTLETLANILDNMLLLSRLPLFPKSIRLLLRYTNIVWVVVLVFLIKRSVTQVVHLNKQERAIRQELAVILMREKCVGKLFQEVEAKHEQMLSMIKIKRVILYIELAGNSLDFLLNLIDIMGWKPQRSLMTVLNASSVLMSMYRMNKVY